MTVQQVKQKIIDTIVTSTETDVEITEATEIVGDMGLSSMQIFILLGDLEGEFGIDISTDNASDVRTVGDLQQMIIDLLRG